MFDKVLDQVISFLNTYLLPRRGYFYSAFVEMNGKSELVRSFIDGPFIGFCLMSLDEEIRKYHKVTGHVAILSVTPITTYRAGLYAKYLEDVTSKMRVADLKAVP